jgi:hypothetical protein
MQAGSLLDSFKEHNNRYKPSKISEGYCHEQFAVDNCGFGHLVIASGSHSTEVWRTNLTGEDPPGDG